MTNTELTVLDGLALVLMVATFVRLALDVAQLWPLRHARASRLAVGAVVVVLLVNAVSMMAAA